jgi:hypothetical protein
MAIIALFFVTTLGLGLASLTMHNVRITRRNQQSTVAFNLAESGAERAVRWLKDQSAGIYSITTRDPFGGWVTTAGGRYRATVAAFPEDMNAALRRFRITAVGQSGDRTESVEIVVRQQSFGLYAYFTDRETSSLSSGNIWFASSDRIRGPAHSNNAQSSEFQINWGTSTSPIFEGMLTSVANDITYSPRRPSNETEFQRIYMAGSHGYQLGVDPIPLPDSTTDQRNAAWGGTSGFPTSNGVYVRDNGGVYIRGDCTIAMSVQNGTTQVLTIVRGSTTFTVTINRYTGTMTRRQGTGSTVSYSNTTGVIYCTGNITSLSGTIADNTLNGAGSEIQARNSLTIATDVNAGKYINLTNTLTHNTQINFGQPMTSSNNIRPGTLGLIARNIIVDSAAPTNMQIDAVLLAGSNSYSDGSFYVEDYNTRQPVGTLRVTGGIIQKARGPVGTISGSTISTGYRKDYFYDPRIAENPPPIFPITPNYDRISWRRI